MIMKIEKGFKIPAKRGNFLIYPLKDMIVGDSFLVPPGIRGKVQNCVSQYGLRNKKKFSVRTIGNTIRCWRVE